MAEQSKSPLIFTHYGDTDYLTRTLEAARLTNPARRMILIGDQSNRQTALRAGWEHVGMDNCPSELRSAFLSCFQEIKGRSHISAKGTRNWLQYVSERWFIVTAFVQAQNISTFWHFDSDVMIAAELDPFENILRSEGMDFTKQCNGACLNGFVTTPVAEAFCRYILVFLNDEALMDKFRKIARDEPTSGLSEMDFFSYYMKQAQYRGCHLEAHFPGWWFDDVLCQDNECETARMGVFGPVIKDVRFDGRDFTVAFKGQRRQFAVLNCSWLPTKVFDWILKRLRLAAIGNTRARDERLAALWPGLRWEYRGLRSQLKKTAMILNRRT